MFILDLAEVNDLCQQHMDILRVHHETCDSQCRQIGTCERVESQHPRDQACVADKLGNESHAAARKKFADIVRAPIQMTFSDRDLDDSAWKLN